MKHVLICFLTLFAVPFFSSCGNCAVMIDPAPVPVCFIVKDADGNNLLDPAYEGNILGNDIAVTYREEEYPLAMSEPTGDQMGLYTGAVGADKIPGLMFGPFYIREDRGGDAFSINWGDGNPSEEVKFDFYYTVTAGTCSVKGHRKIYLNDKLMSNNSLTVTLVK